MDREDSPQSPMLAMHHRQQLADAIDLFCGWAERLDSNPHAEIPTYAPQVCRACPRGVQAGI